MILSVELGKGGIIDYFQYNERENKLQGGGKEINYFGVRRLAGGEAPLPTRAAARDVLYPLPLVACVLDANRFCFSVSSYA